jgi:hypothetical protein
MGTKAKLREIPLSFHSGKPVEETAQTVASNRCVFRKPMTGDERANELRRSSRPLTVHQSARIRARELIARLR